MREIKFRIWNGREMEYNITAGKFVTFYVNPEKGDGLNPQDTASLTTCTTKYHDGTPVMEFSGEKDIEGKEIYEGDILELTDPYGETKDVSEVRYVNSAFVIEADGWFGSGEYDVTTVGWAIEEDVKLKIIGNIYENPELQPK